MTSQARNFFQRFPPAECLALFIATLELLPFGVAGLSNPTAFADGYGLPIQGSSTTSSTSTKRGADGLFSESATETSEKSLRSFEEDQKIKKALVAAIAARNVQNGVLLFTFGLVLRDRRSLGVAVAAGLVATLADTVIVKAYGAKDKIAGHYVGIFNSLAIGGSLLYWGRNDPLCMAYKHVYLQLEPSPFAELAGYEQPGAKERAAAGTISGKAPRTQPSRSEMLFPSPLVLPHDDLNYDPDCLPQDCKKWQSMKTRNKMTNLKRKILYISRVPEMSEETNFMRSWTRLCMGGRNATEMTSPDAELFVEYLKAFYHGMDVRVLPQQLSWKLWDKSSRPYRRANLPKFVGLADENNSMTRVRVRSVPDKAFAAQLNLDDILDTGIEILPADAYALLLLVDHDIYENEDDDFCCGRAYGGSRVAVVQTARYSPMLDAAEGIDRDHMWPMSHCKTFVDDLCAVEEVVAKAPTKEQRKMSKESAIRAAVDAASGFAGNGAGERDVQALWLARLARTVSHELGHCFGIAHCVYYACNMQGTAGMKEDVRQPPYLCPVCEAKVGHAIVEELLSDQALEKETWVSQRCVVISDFCQKLETEGLTTAMWKGLDAWLSDRIRRAGQPQRGRVSIKHFGYLLAFDDKVKEVQERNTSH
ncbi:hypothetical protein C7974DRAFT_451809 [Boeremia exigua]|uniref:uncharacterized protein n=1 Tax=Boeremia exigua TaxID=749465 RepID=UPI001E8D83E6|nr:uncharacterized protein C7974DRAFT_451809 [Boeremia exigua]KAH6638427.1 hypothetical protein C7974DRAFT_451809 [Boeremia exigua]